MKSFVALSVFVASACAIQYPGYTYNFSPAGYAPDFGYAAYGAPLATPASTAPLAARAVYAAAAPAAGYTPYAFNAFHSFNPYFGLPYAAAAPAVQAVEPAAVESADLKDVEVVEADSTPLKAEGPVVLRAIFPVFGGDDLRSGSENIIFARPDEIIPVPALTAEKADEDDVVELPSLATVVGRNNFYSRFGPVAPAGIVQATQPRFYYQSSPVLAF